MKFTIECAALLKSLSHIQNVVERRHTNPLLSNVKITAQDGAIVNFIEVTHQKKVENNFGESMPHFALFQKQKIHLKAKIFTESPL